jgi:hypothetical protein
MDHARATNAVVLTRNPDFGAMLAAAGGRRPSVVQIRADRLSPEAIGPQVLLALGQLAGELAAGALVTLDTVRTLVALLPIQVDWDRHLIASTSGRFAWAVCRLIRSLSDEPEIWIALQKSGRVIPFMQYRELRSTCCPNARAFWAGLGSNLRRSYDPV